MKKILLPILFSGVSLFSISQSSSLNRVNDPVVITGASIAALNTLKPTDIVAFCYIDGSWGQIPVQVDERALLDIVTPYGALAGTGVGYLPPAPSASNPKLLFYCDTATNVGGDADTTFDSNDELVFMSKDAGGLFTGGGYPTGVVNGTCQQVTITDPLGGTGYVYLFANDGSLAQDAGTSYVTYTSNVHSTSGFPANNNMTNTENTRITTAKYGWHFASEWVSDELKIFLGTGVDILDRHKAFFANSSAGCGRHEGLFSSGENAYIVCKGGPIRALRSYMGAQSGPVTQRTHLFYEGRHDLITNLRVHAIPSIYDAFDYNSAANGMIYTNSLNATGDTINGKPGTITAGLQTWDQVKGKQGTLSIIYRKETTLTPSDATFSNYYDDNSAAPASDCTGTQGAWGTSGVGLQFLSSVCTDCYTSASFRSLEIQRYIYADSASAPANTAANYSTQTDNPLQVSVATCQSNYTITLSSDPVAGGTTSGGGSYAPGTTITVSAVANTGYDFDFWSEGGNVVEQQPDYTFAVGSDRALVANFHAVLGTDDINALQAIKLFPNPSTGTIHISGAEDGKTYTINVFSMYGQLVKSMHTTGKTQSFEIAAQGTYEVVITGENSVKKQRVVVVK
jgi:hypothetical protein